MDLCSTSLSSSRVVLRSFRPEDAREVFAAATPALARYMSWAPAPCLDAFEKIWRGWLPMMVKGSDMHLVVRLGASEEFLGMAGLHNIVPRSPTLEFGSKRRSMATDMAVTRLRLSFRSQLALSAKKRCFIPLQKRMAQAGALLKVSTARSSENGCFGRAVASNTRKSCAEFPSPW
jgi:hypothetical protein